MDMIGETCALVMYCCVKSLITYTRQLRSARSSTKSNNWLMSYVMEGLLGFILFRCSSYILQTPFWRREGELIIKNKMH